MSLYSTTILQDAPVAYYRFGELSGTAAADSSGNANNGTYAGTYTLGRAGAIVSDNNAAVLFNGSSGCMTPGNILNVGLNAGITLECWFKTTGAISTVTGLAGKAFLGPASGRYAILFDNAGGPSFGLVGLWQGVSAVAESPVVTGLDDSQWHHAALVIDRVANTMTLMADGVVKSVTTIVGDAASNLSHSNNFFLGAYTSSGSTPVDFFPGSVDETAVYYSALSVARIKAHYNAGIASLYPANVVNGSPLIRLKQVA